MFRVLVSMQYGKPNNLGLCLCCELPIWTNHILSIYPNNLSINLQNTECKVREWAKLIWDRARQENSGAKTFLTSKIQAEAFFGPKNGCTRKKSQGAELFQCLEKHRASIFLTKETTGQRPFSLEFLILQNFACPFDYPYSYHFFIPLLTQAMFSLTSSSSMRCEIYNNQAFRPFPFRINLSIMIFIPITQCKTVLWEVFLCIFLCMAT